MPRGFAAAAEGSVTHHTNCNLPLFIKLKLSGYVVRVSLIEQVVLFLQSIYVVAVLYRVLKPSFDVRTKNTRTPLVGTARFFLIGVTQGTPCVACSCFEYDQRRLQRALAKRGLAAGEVKRGIRGKRKDSEGIEENHMISCIDFAKEAMPDHKSFMKVQVTKPKRCEFIWVYPPRTYALLRCKGL